MKLCKDCSCYTDKGLCNKFPSLVDGGIETEYGAPAWRHIPKLLRSDDFLFSIVHHTCGKSGRWWEPK